jgi:hypothetical protein
MKKKKKKSHFPLQSSQTDDKFTNLVGLKKAEARNLCHLGSHPGELG